ncbi:MAG: chemotaxis protein CheA [Pseudomonadales bacterium]
MSIDLEQFHQVFFEESLEGLDIMEQSLLTINDGQEPDPEEINTIFRAAHSIKGGSGTFGFSQVADFTHELETLLDEAREGRRTLDTDTVDLLLKSCDYLRAMITSLQAGEAIDTSEGLPLIAAFEAILGHGDSSASAEASTTEQPVASSDSPDPSHHDILEASFDTLLTEGGDSNTGGDDGGSGRKQWRISFQPEPQILMTGNEPLRIFRELAAMGELRTEADTSRIPLFDQLSPDECFIHWTLFLTADVSRDEVLEVFDWVLDECTLQVEQIGPAGQVEQVEQGADAANEPISVQKDTAAVSAPASAAAAEPVVAVADTSPTTAPAVVDGKTTSDAPASAVAVSSSSIRVGIDKVDSLINLVGELVITQSMLSELGTNFEIEKLDRLSNGLEQLLQNTKELQESVMRIRMLPISFAFNRFPRMIRDLCAKTGKKIELKIHGEQTELDKTVMEQISDPLTHLVRNAIDHGIESAEERIAANKPATGTVILDAYHQGGNIVIEISDDGRGLNSEKILQKARDKGLIENTAVLSESKIFELIFEPGFSTAEVVSDISGRGVGMDVVRRNIKALGGRVEVRSKPGKGSTFKVYLPLTLAILDGQLVKVGSEVYIIPLIAIVESLQIKADNVNHVSGDMILYRLREDNVPIIPIHKEFGIDTDCIEINEGLLVVVEGEGQKVGLLVDDLLAQQQVVIKSLESNYKRIEGISGATILGDGSVALIVDVSGLIQQISERNLREQAA